MIRNTAAALATATLLASACSTTGAGGDGAAATSGADVTLAGTTWEVVAYDDGKQGVVEPLAGSRMTARFGTDGQVTGNAGCNRYFASYRQQDGHLEVGMAGATRMFCADPPGLMDQEGHFLEALRSGTTIVLSGDRLELLRADRKLALALRRSATK
jgi:heat shock protein HslJ